MAQDIVALTKLRSMLTILLATCQQTLLVLEATDYALSSSLDDDLRKLVERLERDLQQLIDTLDALKR
jgi:hypothetical protein